VLDTFSYRDKLPKQARLKLCCQLKTRRTQGIQTFAKAPASVHRPAGVAAIVGPNGCGKSNHKRRLSWGWVSSPPKSCRGARMEEVIFARHARPQARSAWPTSHEPWWTPRFSAQDAAAHKAASGGRRPPGLKRIEVTITRRGPCIARARSKLHHRGRAARDLRDLSGIVSGHGPGPESYGPSFEQGRIRADPSVEAADRRTVIEEKAAGITKFKDQKQPSQKAKRKGRQANLAAASRHSWEEVTRQRNSLKRQFCQGDKALRRKAQGPTWKRAARGALRQVTINSSGDAADTAGGRWKPPATELEVAHRAGWRRRKQEH